MSSSDDFLDDMEEFPFDDRDREAVFGTAPGAPDVPESLREVTELVHAARRSASADELVGEDAMVAEIALAIGEHAAPPRRGADERIPVLHRYRTVKLAAAATAVLMLGGTAAAAATGTLPSPVAPSHHRVELASMHESPPAVTPVKAQHHASHHRHGLFGTVAAVNGVSDDGTCGAADTAGAFTLTGRKDKTYTVNVDTTTAFSGKDLTDPSFANVCVGSVVKVKGMIDDTTITATKVRIKPPHVQEQEQDHAFGQVASVNGVSDPGTCGTADTAGTFTLTGFKGDTFTVNVDPATMFKAKDVTDATFANVCVGLLAFGKGALADTTLTATQVFVAPPKPEGADHEDHGHEGAFGTVASVNGVSDPGTCGTAGTDGSFTITDRDGNTVTVNVTADTKFFGKHHDDQGDASSFADVCVGKNIGTKGTVTDSTVAADMVFVLGEHGGHDGKHCDGRHGDRQGDDHESGTHASLSSDRSGSDGEHHDGAWGHHGHHRHGGDHQA